MPKKPREMRRNFDTIYQQIPEELREKAEQENRGYTIQLKWPQGKLTFQDQRGIGVFSLQIDDISFYQEYAIFSDCSEIDDQSLHDLLDDLVTYSTSLLPVDNVIYLQQP